MENKLAACVNIVPGLESVYWWEGKVATDAEELLMIKTRTGLLPELTQHVKAMHPYTGGVLWCMCAAVALTTHFRTIMCIACVCRV